MAIGRSRKKLKKMNTWKSKCFGAALGTFVCPGVGTVIGGLVGGVAGGLAGSSVVRGVFSLFK